MALKRVYEAAPLNEDVGSKPSASVPPSQSILSESSSSPNAPPQDHKDGSLRQTKRMKRLLASDPAAAERMDYRRRLGLARRDDDIPTALQLFADVQARDIDIGSEGFNALIALLTTFERLEDADQVLTHMRRKHFSLTEATYVCIMRALALGGRQPEAAEDLLREMLAGGLRPRLRSYSPIIVGYAEQGKLENAFALYDKMLAQDIEPTETELVALLRGCSGEGGGNVEVDNFYRTLADLQDLVLEPGEGAWEAVAGWFEKRMERGDWAVGHDQAAKSGGRGKDRKAALPQTPSPEMSVRRGVVVDEAGVCSGCGTVLESIQLSSEAADELMTKVEELVLADRAREAEWARFKAWLRGPGGGGRAPEFDTVIDGANVGYFQMNYAQAPPHVNYEQISWVVEHFVGMGKKPLLVLHARHVDSRRVPPGYAALVQKWRERQLLLVVPYRNNDDWFWLFATVFKGGRTLLVTNDEMRDHHFQMLSQRTFLRWKERHQVHFSFGGYEKGGGRSVQIQIPAVYSKCIQGPGNGKAAAGREDENWHLPRAGDDKWLCVQVRRGGATHAQNDGGMTEKS